MTDPTGADPEGRHQADRELRVAVVAAVVALLVGQVLLLAGLWWLAALLIGLPGTVAAVVLARRWQRMAAGDAGTPEP